MSEPKKNTLAIAKKPLEQTRLSLGDYDKIATVMWASGLFPKVDSKEVALSKILFGQALGMSPAESLLALHAVPGKVPSMSALAIGARIKQHPRYDFRLGKVTKEEVLLHFFEKSKMTGVWEEVGQWSFDTEDARRAGLLGKDNWKQYPIPMRYSRCLTAGARAYFPDLFFGNPIYSHEELGNEAEAAAEAPAITESIQDAEWVRGSPQITEAEYQDLVAEATDKGVSLAEVREWIGREDLRGMTLEQLRVAREKIQLRSVIG